MAKHKSDTLELLKDPKHWIGWGLTTGIIIGIFHLLQLHCVHIPWYNAVYLFGIIVVVDLIKHKMGLQ